MPVTVTFDKHGQHGLSLTLRAVTDKAHEHIEKTCKAANGSRVPSEKELGVSPAFLADMWDKNKMVPYAKEAPNRHADTYQYDEIEQTLLVSGRVYHDGQQIMMDAKLILLAANIVSETLFIITAAKLNNDVSWALEDSNQGSVALELTVHTVQNFMFRAHCVQLMKTVFEMLLREQIKTVVAVRFEKTTADAIMAFVHGPMLSPKKAIAKMYKSIRNVMENVLGVHDAKASV